jgi:hypothetical protein
MSSSILDYQQNLTNFFDISNVSYSNSIDLLKKSKKLILNTKRYSNYSNYYNQLTMKHTFKLPNVTNYPIQINEGIIPIKRYNKRNLNLRKVLIKDMNIDNINEKNNKNNTIINSVSNTFLNDFDNSINANRFLKYIDSFNNMDDVVHKYVTYKENYFVDRNKDGNKELLENYLKNEILNYNQEQNPLDKNPIYKKENIFMIKDIEVKLRCDTFVLLFTDENGNKISKIKLPFSCIPFFYGISFDSLKLIFLSVIEFDIESNIFILNKDKFSKIYNNMINTKKMYNINCFLLNHSQMSYLKYDWIITNEGKIKKFTFEIFMPKIKIRFKYLNGFKTTITKSLDTKHISYLFLEKFKDWDLFLVDSFCLIKEFRKTINQALSYTNINKENIKINLDETKIKLYRIKLNNYSIIFFVSFLNENDIKNGLFEIKTPKIQITYNGEKIEPYEKIYNLNLKEAIQLNKMRKSFWPEDMIKRCLFIEEKKSNEKKWVESKLELDKKIFDFDNDLLKYIQRRDKFFSEIIGKKSILKITLLFPFIIWITPNHINEKIYNLKRNEFEELFEIPLNNWHEYIINNYQKIHDNSKVKLIDRNDNKQNTYLKSDKIRRKTRKKSVRNPFIHLTIGGDN